MVGIMKSKRAAFLSVIALAIMCVPGGARADSMRERVAEIRRQLEAQASRPEAERWQDEEAHVMELEGKAEAGGDRHSSAYLKLARERLAKLRRERLMKAWGLLLDKPAATAELRAHAQRAARLKRIRAL